MRAAATCYNNVNGLFAFAFAGRTYGGGRGRNGGGVFGGDSFFSGAQRRRRGRRGVGFLKTVFSVIRWSLIVLILTGLGLLLFARLGGAPFEAVYDGKFLAKLTIVSAIIFGPVLMQWRIVPTSVGGRSPPFPGSPLFFGGVAVFGRFLFFHHRRLRRRSFGGDYRP